MKPLTGTDLAGLIGKPGKVEAVDVPEWGGVVHLRVMSAAERDAYDAFIHAGGAGSMNLTNYRARLVSRCACNADGSPLFDDADTGATMLGNAPSPVMDRLFSVARRLNGLDEGAAETQEKNSESAT